ncbi:vacuolar protein sorting-associated protein 5 [[Candida] railenensis]|uniref:Vacuolar protein sorting-associated protein 5 n=1 Tax=[Candida] railenensis TaxID=45579 RepID=A0A9P0VZD3_9ASCO|nr:vacuolar protein sorting-associated protein 5 [[Candida] railenensis]
MDQDDLTASHWDDVLTTPSVPFGSVHINAAFENGFQDDPLNQQSSNGEHNGDSEDDDEEDEGEVQEQNRGVHSQFNDLSIHHSSYGVGANNHNDAEADQLAELAKEERKEHRSNLLSELTEGADIEESIAPSSPGPKNPSESLFKDTTSPLKVKESSLLQSPSASNNNNSNASDLGKSRLFTRARRYNSKTIVENLNNNPLGPLGSEQAHESESSGNVRDQLLKEVESPLYKIPKEATKEGKLEDLRHPIIPRPTAAPTSSSNTANNDESAASAFTNNLDITVGDPMKVGDITTAHIVYTIYVKKKNVAAEEGAEEGASAFPSSPEPVSRRYRDFRWIYHQLQNNHPGIIIPPPPTKQTYIGRFNESFIENRRLSLEKMLTKISNLPSIYNDPDFVMFLTSPNFTNEAKERERLSGSEASNQNDDSLDSTGNHSNSDMNSSILLDEPSSAGSGFMSSLFSISNKVNEPNDLIKDKKTYIEDLEYNLRNFFKSLELIGTQRNEIIILVEEISNLTEELSSLEISKKTTDLLAEFSEIHLKLKDNLDRTNLQDQLTLGFTIEEYLRIIGSIKYVFSTRLKIYNKYQTSEQELYKKQSSFDKFVKKYKSQSEKINLMKFEIDKLEAKTLKFKQQFTVISETITNELERFEFEKIDDFRNSVEIFIESSIESQKEAIELWETFYERQNLGEV